MKRISKYILSFSMVSCLLFSTLPMTILASNTPSPWAAEHVNAAFFVNLVPENLQSNYTQPITRAEFSALAVTLFEIVNGEITGRVSFADTNDVNVEKAAYIGIVSGVGNNNFDPGAALTREQAAVMLVRLSDAIGQPLPARAATMANFSDNNSIAPWAIESVGKVSATGIMGGVEGNLFAPQQLYTREQAIVTIMRIFETIRGVEANVPGDTSNSPTPPDRSVAPDRNENRDRSGVRDRHGNVIDDSAALAERANFDRNDPRTFGGEGFEGWKQRMLDQGFSMEKIEVIIYGPNHPRFTEFFEDFRGVR